MKINIKPILALALVSFLAAGTLRADDEKIDKIMKAAMKGDTSLFKKVCTGKGTPEDAKKLSTSATPGAISLSSLLTRFTG